MPTLTSKAPEMAANAAASSSATIIAGEAPAASNTLAVISCTTSLVSRCTKGVAARIRASSSAMMLIGSVFGMLSLLKIHFFGCSNFPANQQRLDPNRSTLAGNQHFVVLNHALQTHRAAG